MKQLNNYLPLQFENQIFQKIWNHIHPGWDLPGVFLGSRKKVAKIWDKGWYYCKKSGLGVRRENKGKSQGEAQSPEREEMEEAGSLWHVLCSEHTDMIFPIWAPAFLILFLRVTTGPGLPAHLGIVCGSCNYSWCPFLSQSALFWMRN